MDLALSARDTRILDKRRDAMRARVHQAFSLFDRDANGTCDVREVGTIVRSLGLNPTQRQLASLLEEMEDDEPTGFIRYEKFEKIVLNVCVESEFKGERVSRPVEDDIIRAFRVLDPENTGSISADTFKELMASMAEKLTAEEIEEMTNVAVDPESGNVFYEDYASLLAAE
eukprot:ANDGO_05610.mRNA.1 Calmodulin